MGRGHLVAAIAALLLLATAAGVAGGVERGILVSRAAGVLALVGKRVVAGEADRLPELEDELAATLSSQS